MKLPSFSRISLRRLFSVISISSLIIGTLYFGSGQSKAASTISIVSSSATKGATVNYEITLTSSVTIPQFSYLNISLRGNGPMEEGYAADFSSAIMTSFSPNGKGEFDDQNSQSGNVGIIITQEITANTEITINLSNVKNPTQSGLYTPVFDVNNQENKLLEVMGQPLVIGNLKVQGKIEDPLGNPAAYTGLGLTNETSNYQGNTGEDGSFGFFDIPAGNYQLQIYLGPGSQYISPDPQEITVGNGVTNVGIIALVSPSKLVTGKVTYPDGSPVTTASVNANRRGAPGWYGSNTNAQGNFSLGLPGGEFEIMLNPQWGPEGQLSVDWAYMGRPVTIAFANDTISETKSGVNFQVVNASSVVKGKVVDPDGVAVSQGGVDVRNKEGQGSSGGFNNQGVFSINVPAGKYNINVFANDQSLAVPPMESFTVAEDQTKDLGTITLVRKTAHIKGKVVDEDNQGIAEVQINAWQSSTGGGWGNTQTNGQGTFDLLVSSGTWEINAMPTPDQDYAMAGGPPTRITLGTTDTVTGVNFHLITADATIIGQVVDSNNQLLGNIYGYAEARSASKEEMPMPGMGSSIQNGQFTLKVPAGTYEVSAMFEPGSPYTSLSSEMVTVASQETENVLVVVREDDATISGFVYDEEGNKITGQRIDVFGFNDENSQKMTMVDEETGGYTLGVLGGSTWFLGVYIDSQSGYVMVPPDNNKITLEVGDTATKDFTLLTANATLSGTVLDPDGNPLPNVYVFIDSKAIDDGTVLGASSVRSGEPVGGPGDVLGVNDHVGGPGDNGDEGPGVHFGDLTRSDGTFIISIPAGTYGLGSGAPSSLGFISPGIQKVTIEKDEEITDLVLQYKESDAQITGSVYLNGEKSSAFVWAWSESGGFSGNFTSSGDFTLNVTQGDIWHIGADFDTSEHFYRSDEYIVEVDSEIETQDLVLQEASYTMPASISQTFDASTPKVLTLDNGMTITIPAGALATEGNVTVTVTPTARLAKQKSAKPLAFGYELKAYNSSGQEITTAFNSSVNIVMPYTEEMLAEMGITEDDLSGAYWDDTSTLWQGIESYVVDQDNNRITLTIDHFTSFALVTGASDTIPAAAPTSVTVTDPETGGVLNIAWVNPIDTDFEDIRVYRSTVLGTIGDLVTNITDSNTSYSDTSLTNGTTYYYTVRSVDAAGNESYNTDQYSGVPTQALTELPETGLSMLVLKDLITKLVNIIWNLVGF